MSRHPFTDEDITETEVVIAGLDFPRKIVDDILQSAWDSAVARGAVSSVNNELVITGPAPIQAPGYFIKLPEDKKCPPAGEQAGQ